ncbi:MAG TPA: hypothetical protein VHS79_04315, partial [Actinomycetes bacterium]|nr:hypothetical protein [Actinomycetes bacterium]
MSAEGLGRRGPGNPEGVPRSVGQQFQGGAPMDRDVFAAMDQARRQGRTVVMGTTVRTEGDPPSVPGNRALLGPAGALQ